jgi:hypothetical protein
MSTTPPPVLEIGTIYAEVQRPLRSEGGDPLTGGQALARLQRPANVDAPRWRAIATEWGAANYGALPRGTPRSTAEEFWASFRAPRHAQVQVAENIEHHLTGRFFTERIAELTPEGANDAAHVVTDRPIGMWRTEAGTTGRKRLSPARATGLAVGLGLIVAGVIAWAVSEG